VVDTTVFLLRHGETDWTQSRRILGQRDIGLNADGLNQARAAALALKAHEITEVIASPMLRTVQTAEVVAGLFDLEVARDPRLGEIQVGRWEGMPYDAVEMDPDYQRFLGSPETVAFPGGERLSDVRDRAAGSVHQALTDNPWGTNIVLVSHATVIRVLLAHYLGLPLVDYRRLRVSSGALSVLRFEDDRDPPRILTINYLSSMAAILR
jgi:broad specificity phosphatase PhoE